MPEDKTKQPEILNPIFENKWVEEYGDEGLEVAHSVYPNYDTAVLLVKNVPEDMKSESKWLIWSFDIRKGRITKVPRDINRVAKDPKIINRTFPEVINTFGQYVAGPNSYHIDGVGFLIEQPHIFFDYDDALDENGNIIDPNVQKEVELLHSYTEISPSGRGLHVIAKGNSTGLKSARTEKKEIYFYDRYTTMTGNIWNNDPEYSTIRNIDDETLHAIYDPIAKRNESHRPVQTNMAMNSSSDAIIHHACNIIETDGSDDDIIEHLYDYEYSTKLFNGDYESITTDHSLADIKLCCQITKYTRNPNQIDAIFRRSGLMRPKWDEMRGSSTYGRGTIEKALNW